MKICKGNSENNFLKCKELKNIKTYPQIFLKIAAIHRRTSSTETMIVPETKQRNESFSFQSLSQ